MDNGRADDDFRVGKSMTFDPDWKDRPKEWVVNLRSAPYDVYIGRGSVFGNPFTHISDRKTLAAHVVTNRDEAIRSYRQYFLDRVNSDPEFRVQALALRGKVLGCFCKPLDCHGDIIVQWLKEQDDTL